MIDEFPLATGASVWLVRGHIVSLQPAKKMVGGGTIIRMVNGDQWATTLDIHDIIVPVVEENPF